MVRIILLIIVCSLPLSALAQTASTNDLVAQIVVMRTQLAAASKQVDACDADRAKPCADIGRLRAARHALRTQLAKAIQTYVSAFVAAYRSR